MLNKVASRTRLQKKQGGSEEIPKKMRNFVGSFDCIDKLKHALRQSLKQ